MTNRIPVTPTGEYAAIEVSDQHVALAALADPRSRGEAVARVLAAPEEHSPPVLMAMAAVVFADGHAAQRSWTTGNGHRETGAFWFYAAQLRARIDANRCTDPSAAAACGVLTETYGPPINRWAFHEPGLLPHLIDRVAQWDAATASVYDPRWIALHGMGAFTGTDTALTRPAAQWPSIAAETRREFVEGVHELYDDDGRLRTELFGRPRDS